VFEEKGKVFTYILEVHGLTRHFGGLAAISDFDLGVQPGEFFGVIGPNGAGKTTLFNLISGVLPPTRGKVHFSGAEITGKPPYALPRLGLARTFQITALFQSFTVLENVLLGTYGVFRVNPLATLWNTRRAGETERVQRDRALELLYFLGIDRLRDEVARNLPLGHQRILELAVALASSPKMLLLDEPSLGLAPLVVIEIFRIIRRINEEEGTTIVLVEQNARMALQIAHYGYVMENGKIVMEGAADDLRDNPDIREFYLGMSATGNIKSYTDVKSYRRRKRWL